MLDEPYISADFTVSDIHKVREYNYEMTKDMTKEECEKYYQADIDYGRKRIAELRKTKTAQNIVI